MVVVPERRDLGLAEYPDLARLHRRRSLRTVIAPDVNVSYADSDEPEHRETHCGGHLPHLSVLALGEHDRDPCRWDLDETAVESLVTVMHAPFSRWQRWRLV